MWVETHAFDTMRETTITRTSFALHALVSRLKKFLICRKREMHCQCGFTNWKYLIYHYNNVTLLSENLFTLIFMLIHMIHMIATHMIGIRGNHDIRVNNFKIANFRKLLITLYYNIYDIIFFYILVIILDLLFQIPHFNPKAVITVI